MWPETTFDTRLRVPSGGIICGGTMSGRTHFVANMIKWEDQVFNRTFDRIVYVYNEWQPLYDELLKTMDGITFTKKITKVFENYEFFNSNQNTLLVLYDVVNSLVDYAFAPKSST